MRCLFFLLLLSFTARAQERLQVSGDWSGSLSVMGTELPLIFHITENPDGSLSATLDSPKQGATGIPVQQVRLQGDSLYLNLKAIGGTYAGKRTNAQTIDGNWRQGGQSLPLQLKRGGTTEALMRPQTPKPPFPYQSTEVTIENKAAGIKLVGTLTLPQGKGPHPAVLLLSGSGPQDRDETILGHKPFLVLADHLTRQGFAVLRLDDRGVGKSGGDFNSATTADFATDAEAAYNYLRNHSSINKKKVGLLGHSEGALVAAKAAAAQPSASFVVLLAGNAVPGTELLIAQNKALLQSTAVPQELLQAYLQLREAQIKVAATEKNVAKAAEQIRKLEQEAKAGMALQEQQQLGLTDKAEDAVVAQLSSPWMRYYLAYNPAPTLQQLKMPVLALNGTKDLQVPAWQNLPATEKALRAAGNRKYKVQEMEGLNHLFQTATTGSPAEYGQLEETFAPAALETIAQWMQEVVK